jgi:hypothetical protein
MTVADIFTRWSAIKNGLPPHALTVPVLPMLFLSIANVSRISIGDAITATGTVVGLYLLVLVFLRAIFRRPVLTDVMLALGFCAIYMPIMFTLHSTVQRMLWIGFWGLLMVVALLWQEGRRLLHPVLTVFSVMLGGLQLFSSPEALRPLWTRSEVTKTLAAAFDPVPSPAKVTATKPDIYYFIFDRYQREDYLRSIYGHDNAVFLDALRARGFFIADKSYSNYQRTAHSVISSLNFDYLDRMQSLATAQSSDWQPLYNMFQDFRIARVLKSMNYEIRFSGSWWEPTRRIGIADQNRTFYEVPELLRVFHEHSLVVPLGRAIGLRQVDPLYWQCQRSRLMFEDLQASPQADKPVFHFAHFLIPHPPFVTHESGRCLEIAEAKARSRAENYSGQIRYANAQILKTVDALLARPGPKPIIILQADEGPWPEEYADDEITILGRDVTDVDWTSLEPEKLREKMAILNAIYAPGIPQDAFSASQSPVNTFRMVLKHYFDVPIDLLPDRYMVYVKRSDLYSFADVTDKVRAPAQAATAP